MKRLTHLTYAVLILALAVGPYAAPVAVRAASAPPTILSYQGRLTDSSGDLLGSSSGTTYYFKFSIWNNATVGSGSRVWPSSAPTATTGTVRQGVFNINIGDTANGYPDTLNLDFSNYSALYLQVEVSSDGATYETLSPRQQVTTAAYASLAGGVVGTTTQSALGTTTPYQGSALTLAATSSGATPLSIFGAASQSGNLLQIFNNSLSHLFSINSSGALFASSTATSTFAGGLVINGGGLKISTLTSANCDLKADANGNISCGTDATSAGAQDPFQYGINYGVVSAATSSPLWAQSGVFASSTSQIAYASSTALTVSGTGYFGTASSTNLRVSGTQTFENLASGGLAVNASGSVYTFATSTWTFASSTLLADSNTWSGNNTFSNLITGSISGNAGTVTNGVYTTTFGTLFDNRLSASSSIAGITTLPNLSLPVGQLTGTLGVASGGTGSTTLSGVLVGNGTSQVQTATVSSPLTFSGSTLSITQSGAATDGYLSSTDWNLFNNKISSSSLSGGSGISYNSATGVIASTVAFPFTSTTNYGAAANSTSTPVWFTAGLQASSTSQFVYASTTALTVSGTLFAGSLNGPLQANNGLVSATTSVGTLYGGTGISSYSTGDILYASAANTLTALPIGGAGTVLKVSGGIPSWGADLTSSGSSGLFSTTTDSLAIYPSTVSNVLLLGASATTTTGNILEALGNTLLRGALTAYNTITAPSFTATSTSAASTFPYASSTALTVSGALYSGTASTSNLTVSNLPAALLSTNASGGAQSTTVSSPLSFSGSTLSITQSGAAADGYLSSTDWNLFNNKISSSSLSGGSGISYNSATGVIASTVAFPFTSTTNYGAAANSTSTPVWFTAGLQASSTAHFVYASSTALTVSGNFYGASLSTCNTSADKLLWANGVFSCGTDSGASGSDVNWTHFNGSGIRVTTATDQVLVGFTSTSTLSKLEVVGGATIDNATTTTLYSSTVVANSTLGIGTSSPSAKLTLSGGNFYQTASGAPTLAATVATTTNGAAYASAVSGRYAYIAEDAGGLRIVDISAPRNPVFVGSYALGGAKTVAVAGRYAYVGDTSTGLNIIDVSKPSAPALVGTYTMGGTFGLALSGKYAFVSDFNNAAVRIIDVSNPSAPSLAGSVSVATSKPYGLAVSGTYLYIADQWNSKIYIVDISNPASPARLGTYTGSGAPSALYASGKYLYVGDDGGGFYILDVSNPNATPSVVGTYNTSGSYYGVQVAGDYAYLTDHSGSVTVLDIHASTTPALVGSYSTGGTPWGITLSGKYAYAAANTSGLKVIDINGTDVPAARIGALESNTINVSEDVTVGNNIYAGGGLNVGVSGIFSRGTIAAYVASSTQTNPVVANFMGGNVGVGTSTPYAMLSVAGQVVGQNFVATSTTAVSQFQQLLALSSTTLQNFTFNLATGTSATTTNFFATTASSTNLFAAAAQLGALTLNNFSAGGLAINSSGAAYTFATSTWTFASSTLLGDNNTFSGSNIFSSPLSLTGTTGTSTIAAGQGFTIGSSQFVLQQGSGNVGIGTVSPVSALSVLGAAPTASTTLDFSGVGFGSTYWVQNLMSSSTFATAQTGSNVSNLDFLSVNPSTAITPTISNREIVASIPNSNSTAFSSSVVGTRSSVRSAGSGYTGTLFGGIFDASNLGAGSTVTSVRGIQTGAGNISNGNNQYSTTTAAYGVLASMLNNTTNGLITNRYGAYVSASNSGTVTNDYGFYATGVGVGGTVTNKYDFYGADTGAYNYFGGNVGIGTTTPYAALSVAGQSVFNYITATGTTASTFPYASTTALTVSGTGYFGTASSTNLRVSGTQTFENLASGGLAVNASGSVYAFATSTWTFASSTLLADNNTFSGSNIFSSPLSLTGTTGTSTIAAGQGFTIGSSQFVLQQGSGNVGIGTVSPVSALSVLGAAPTASTTLDFSGVGFGSTYWVQNLMSSSTLTAVQTGTNVNNLDYLSVNPSTTITQGILNRDMVTIIPSTNSTSFSSSVIGMRASVRGAGSGYTGALTGGFLSALNIGAGSTVSSVKGADITSGNLGVGNQYSTTTAAYGALISMSNSTTNGLITNRYGAYVSAANSGTVTNDYGFYATGVGVGGTVTNKYDFYGADTGAYNYFGGNVGIGSTTPAQKLSVAGTIYTTTGIQFGDGTVQTTAGATYIKRLAAIYSNGTAQSNQTIQFGAAATASGSFTGTLTLPASTTEMVVEVWGAGGNGASGPSGGGGGGGYSQKLIKTPSGTYYYTTGAGGGNSSCFGTNSTACTSPTISATGGGTGGSTNGGTGGAGSGGDINLTGQGGGGSDGTTFYGAGGSAPRGGSGGAGNNGSAGSAFGGGGSGGSGAGGAGGIVVTVYATSSPNSAGNDYAEMFPVSNPGIGAGDIVAVDAGQPVSMKLAERGDRALAGAISTAPGQTLGDINALGMRPVALAGRVPVKVNMENGPIAIGDRIAISSVAGVGMKAGFFDASVGIALEPATAEGTVMTLLDIQQGVSVPELGLALLGADASATVATSTSTASSTPWWTGNSFIGGLFSRIAQWFADAANGIGDFFAGRVHTKELCVEKSDGTEVCVTGDQLATAVAAAGNSAQVTGSSATSTSTATGNLTPTTSAPVISVNGANPATIDVGSVYADLGATITGPESALNLGIHVTVSSEQGTVNSFNSIGEIILDTSTSTAYTITYSATDQAGLTGTATRTVNVVDSTSLPQVDPNGSNGENGENEEATTTPDANGTNGGNGENGTTATTTDSNGGNGENGINGTDSTTSTPPTSDATTTPSTP